MPKYEFDAERWLRSNAQWYARKGILQMERNMAMCADEIHRLRMADDLHQQGAELMREELAEVRAELAALKAAVKPIAKWWRGGGIEGVIKGVNKPIDTGQLDVLAALVGEE